MHPSASISILSAITPKNPDREDNKAPQPPPLLYEVAVDAPLFTTLTYKPPKDYNEPLQSGSVVLVPLGKQKVTGYVLGHAEKTSESLP